MSYGLPAAITSSTELESAEFQKWTDSLNWHLTAIPFVFDDSGNAVESTYGLGLLDTYVYPIDPSAYKDYAGAGSHFGSFYIAFPAGLFSELLFVKCMPATSPSSNGMMVATVSGESPGGVRVFVYDTGGSAIIYPFAVWVIAIGILRSGKLE